MNPTILETVLAEQTKDRISEGQPFDDFFQAAKQSDCFEVLVLSTLMTMEAFPHGQRDALRVCLAYALYSGAAYAKAEREVRELEEIT